MHASALVNYSTAVSYDRKIFMTLATGRPSREEKAEACKNDIFKVVLKGVYFAFGPGACFINLFSVINAIS